MEDDIDFQMCFIRLSARFLVIIRISRLFKGIWNASWRFSNRTHSYLAKRKIIFISIDGLAEGKILGKFKKKF